MRARQATAKAIADPSATDSSLQNTPASSQVPLLLSSSPLFSSGLPPQSLQVVALVGLTNLQASAFPRGLSSKSLSGFWTGSLPLCTTVETHIGYSYPWDLGLTLACRLVPPWILQEDNFPFVLRFRVLVARLCLDDCQGHFVINYMGKRKTREPNTDFQQPISLLFDGGLSSERAEKLRRDIQLTLAKQEKLVQLLRHEIPESRDSDSKNLLQELTDRLSARLNQVETLITVFTDRQIDSYVKVRREKKRQRRTQ